MTPGPPAEQVVRQLPLVRAAEATGTVVVVDVLRAFTTVPHALANGAASIRLVAEVGEALRLRDEGVVDLALGEHGGHPIDGFDLSNSPAEVAATDLTGQRLAMRTSAGTQGAVTATGATRLLTGAFVNASATAEALRDDPSVTFLVTGESEGRDGDEDRALADYVTALLRGASPDPGPYLARVAASDHGRRFGDDLPRRDLELACEVDQFAAPVEVHRRGSVLLLEGADARWAGRGDDTP